MPKYNIGIYLRLSMKDRGYKDESISIQTQSQMINEYIDQTAEFQESSRTIYCDDGFTGTNFDRPDFKRLLEDIKDNKINCVVVRDISRFGRNYIEVGNYIEKIFPFMNVRFIAVSDDYDSNNAGDVGSLLSAFKSVFADIYSKELSVKIKTAMDKYSEEGKYMAGNTPYGYTKDENDKRKIVVDEEAADIVKWIFEERAYGKKYIDIARKLNELNVLSPIMHKRTKNKNIKRREVDEIWTGSSIKTITMNPMYVGDYVYNKSEIHVVGSGQIKSKPKKEWKTVKNNHPALVTRTMFKKVNTKKKKNPKQTREYQKIKVALPIKCGHCKTKVKIRDGIYYCSRTDFSKVHECEQNKIAVDTLESTIKTLLEKYVLELSDKKKIIELNPTVQKIKELEKELNKKRSQVNRWTKRLEDLLKDNFEEKISDDVFEEQSKLIYLNREPIEQTIKELELKITELKKAEKSDQKFNNFFENIDFSDKELAKALIDEIIIVDKDSIEIKWKYKEI